MATYLPSDMASPLWVDGGVGQNNLSESVRQPTHGTHGGQRDFSRPGETVY